MTLRVIYTSSANGFNIVFKTKQMKQKGDEEKKCDPLAEALYSLLSENQKVIDQIEDKLAERITKAELDSKQAQALVGVQRMSTMQLIKSYRETKKALQSNNMSSDTETRYLRLKLKTLSEAIPLLLQRVSSSSDPGLQMNTSSTAGQIGLTHYRIVQDLPKIRAGATQDLIQLLKFLQSGKQLSDSDAIDHLSRLALMLDDLSMFEEAEIISAQVVPIARGMVSNKEPDGDLRLSVALDCLAKAEYEVGKNEDAPAASEESVKRYRGLMEKNAQTLPSMFVVCLIGLLVIYHLLGKYEEAIKIAEEAVDTSRRHANDYPSDIIPVLGIAVATDIFHGLLKKGQKHFLPYLAFYLGTSSFTLTKLGQHDEALAATKESVKIYRKLIKYGPLDSYLYRVFPLYTMACCHYKMDQYQKALPMIEESLTNGRHLFNPELDQYNKARFLNLRALCLLKLGRYHEAVEVGKEVLEIVRLLDEKCPAIYGEVVSEYLLHQSRALYGKGDNKSAKLVVPDRSVPRSYKGQPSEVQH
ncbi:hypothetical protein FRC03_001822 [Tulasnella sp. 419]|nr:hypothetical protein FRC03_001822 [Tulasnella sp. 419]